MRKKLFPFLPSNKNCIGILGGGQLGKMIAIAASNLGYQTILYCPEGDNPAEQVVNKVYHGSWDDFDKIDHFASQLICATSEFENVPSVTLERIEQKTYLFPNSFAFQKAQSRDKEKELAYECGFKVPEWYMIKSFHDLEKFSSKLKFNAILKTNTLGYDGKGQKHINNNKNLREIWYDIGSNNCVLEEKIDFIREVSILFAKSSNNSECFFPVAENTHRGGILRQTFAPALIENKILNKIKQNTKLIANKIKLTGLLAIEMFQLENGEVIFNEMAPRPHNSFHWTLEGCLNSQFDILIKSICGHKICDQFSSNSWQMKNIIGEEIHLLNKITRDTKNKCYIYGKKEIKSDRKMGHYTFKIN